MMERATGLRYICLISRSLKAPLRTAIYGLTLVAVLLAAHAQAQQRRTSQQPPTRIFLNLHYDYWDAPRQEVAGKAIDLEYSQVVMAAFNRLGFKPDELKVEPLFP